MDKGKSKRSLRVALVLGAALAGTALVGWGGLAAWQAYTQNNGSSVTAATLSHSNTVGTTSCNSVDSASSAAALDCGVILDATADSSSWSGTTGTVTIVNTGGATSTFQLSSPNDDAPTGALCADLNLTITDGEASPATVYSGSLSSAISDSNLAANNGDTSWVTNDTGTYTFSVTPNGSFADDNSAPGESCSFDVLFTQGA
jgi:hypothetical protein